VFRDVLFSRVMASNRTSFELFAVDGGITGVPERLAPASFAGVGAMELQDIERWIRERPLLVGEQLKIVTNQFAGFEGAKDRLDVLALDRQGRIVVIEVKRDHSGAYQDLQALRYGAFVSTFSAEQLSGAYADYVVKSEGRPLEQDDARRELEAFIDSADLDVVDADQAPRIILVAAGFGAGVTSTVLWLRRAFGVDISCVQLVPYEIAGELLLGSSILIPLPEAKDYEVRVAEKQQSASAKKATKAPLDQERAKRFIASIPDGRWASYGDVASAGGSPQGAMGVGSWLSSKGDEVTGVYRVLNAWGQVSEGWKAAALDLPPTPSAVRERLEHEGVTFDIDGRADQAQRWTVQDWEAAVHPVNPAAQSVVSTDTHEPPAGGEG
jgi:alkylated DNA nucleotide flippase Atl1